MNSLDTFVKFMPSGANPSVSISANNSSTAAILTDVEAKAKRFSNGLTDSLYELSNEPSLGLYRIQEHVRKNMPTLIDRNLELAKYQEDIKGNIFDLEYSIEAVNKISNANQSLDSIKQLLTDSLYAARQISIRNAKLKASPKGSSSQPNPSTSGKSSLKSTTSNFSITSVVPKALKTSSISIYENLNKSIQGRTSPQRSQTIVASDVQGTKEESFSSENKQTNMSSLHETEEKEPNQESVPKEKNQTEENPSEETK